MPFDKFINKAKNLANDPKVRDKLKSEKAEKASDSILDKAAGVAESLTNGKHTDKIQKARDAADRAVGTDGNSGNDQTEDERTARERTEDDHPDSHRTDGDRTDERRRGDEGGPRP